MADLLAQDAAFEAEHDVCDRCQAVFRMIEGCLCKTCGRKHWHDEICVAAVERENLQHPFGYRGHTRYGLAGLILIRLGNATTSVVVGIQRVRDDHAAQIWVRDLERPGVRIIEPDELMDAIRDDLPFALAFEAVDPPPFAMLSAS